jgi:hypothetical protein
MKRRHFFRRMGYYMTAAAGTALGLLWNRNQADAYVRRITKPRKPLDGNEDLSVKCDGKDPIPTPRCVSDILR